MSEIITEKAFKETKATSYSRLSKLADGPQAYKIGLEDKPESSALSLGSTVDILLTSPDKFNEEIFVMSVDKPSSDMMCKFCEVYAETKDSKLAHVESGFKLDFDRVWKKFEKEGATYYDALIRSEGKKIIDFEGYSIAQILVKQLQENEFTKKYFKETNDVELMYQVPILWSIDYISLIDNKRKNIPAKSLIDLIYIDHENEKIKPIELKTGAEGFFKSYRRYRRILQGGMYFAAIIQAFKEKYKKQYVVETPRFIYADTNLMYPPSIYRMSDGEIYASKYGRNYINLENRFIEEIKIKGYQRLAAELEWHEKNDKWDYSYDVYQNNGEININSTVVKL